MTTVLLDIDEQTISDMFISALEGGSNYWIGEVQFFDKHNKKVRHFPDNPLEKIAMMRITANDDEPTPNPPPPFRDQVQRGLQIMAKDYRRHFADILSENADAETSDVFLQCCVFGKVIYG